jgi:HEAT repeat protein
VPKPPSKQARHAADLAVIGPDPRAVRAYLDAHSNLPGPRGNLELAHAFADWAPDDLVDSLAPDDDEYIRFCTVLALGQRLAGRGDPGLVEVLRGHARDARWRVREAVATGLQRVGDRNLPHLVAIVEAWAHDDDRLVQRAAVAAICEPRLLASPVGVKAALAACRDTTGALAALPLEARRRDDVRALRQALGYCWSVAIAADPSAGLPSFAELRASEDPDVRWIVRENLRKARLQRVLTPSP